MASNRARPAIRLLFDELLPPAVARALNELGFRTSHVGHVAHNQPPRGSDDATVLAHAAATNQTIVTANHDMIMLCAERGQPVIWIDPRGRQLKHDELAVLAFTGIARWQELLRATDGPACVRVLRTKAECVALAEAGRLAENRMRALRRRSRRRAAARGRDGDQLTIGR